MPSKFIYDFIYGGLGNICAKRPQYVLHTLESVHRILDLMGLTPIFLMCQSQRRREKNYKICE